MKPKVYITRKIPDEALEIIAERCQYRIWDREDEPVPRDVLEREVRDVEGLFSLLTERVDEQLLDSAPKLKVVANMAVGYDNVDVAACMRRGIVVTNTPGVLTETTADLAFALMLAAGRRVTEAERFLRQGMWKTWSPMLLTGVDVYGATLGIIGLGRIGEAVARRARGFSMRVLYTSGKPRPDLEASLGVERRELDSLLRDSDFVSIHVPLTEKTRGMIGGRELALMKPTAVLVNTSRGPVVREPDLIEALREKRIFAAGLDVFETEPLPQDSPLLELDNVVLLPHIASASIATRTEMAVMAANNLVQVLYGDEALNPVTA
jgi:glyoxylate reductase